MAKYQVTHSCGHEQTHKLIGKHKDRERKLEWLATTLCAECYAAKRDADNKVASDAAAEAAQATGLPALTGSEKQIAWAETLRRTFLRDLDQIVAARRGVRDERYSEAAWAEICDALVLLADEPRSWTQARQWIDSREVGASYWFRRQWVERGPSLAPTAEAERAARMGVAK